MQRRTLLKLGTGAAVALALAGGGVALFQPGLVDGRLTPAGRRVFEAVAHAVLDGSLPKEPQAKAAALAAHLQRLEQTLAGLPAATRGELSQLLALLAAAPGRVTFAGLRTDWADADVAQVQAALQNMRRSGLALRQQAYHALRDLTNAAYYADPSTWSLLGYPGPRET